MKPIKCYVLIFVLFWIIPVRATVSTLVADTKSGFVLASDQDTIQQPPASLTKLMTLYLTFGALDSGVLKLEDQLPISEQAAAQPRSKIGVVAGETITVKDAILALIIKSANDVSVVLAEALGQTEEKFADMMTRTAKGLGLKNTVFKNASGLHVPGQVSTARDMAVLTMALIAHYPQYYSLFSTQSFKYKGQVYQTHNAVLQQYEGAEGLKTGFVSAGGYNIISTAKKDKTRLVSVVLGEETPLKRDLRAMRLLDKGFRQVSIQMAAQADGRLKSAFNPLNRQAFISRPPIQIFLPIMKTCWALSRKSKYPSKVVHAAVQDKPADAVEQGDNWSIQVGAFEKQDKAQKIAEEARMILGKPQKTIQTPRANNRFFRSRIRGFSQNEAQKACRLLKNERWQCLEIAPNNG